MRRFSHLLIVVLYALVAAPAFAQDAVHWHNDLESAKTMAKSTNRLVLIHFWAPSCGPCMALERNVFNQPGVASAIEQQYVPVKLNADENSATAQLYGITRIPTDVITTPDGQIVSKMISPPTPAAYIAEVTSAAGKYASKAGQAYANAASAAPAPSQMNSAYARLAVSPTTPPAAASPDASPAPAQNGNSLAALSMGSPSLGNGSQTQTPRLSNSTPNFPSVPAATAPVQQAGPSMGPATVPATPVAQVTPSMQPSYGAASATPAAPQVIANPAVAASQPSRSAITPIGSPTYQPAPAAPTLNAAAMPSQTTNPYFASASTASSSQSSVNPPSMTPAQPVAAAAPQWPSVYSPQSQAQPQSQVNPLAPPVAGIAQTANASHAAAAAVPTNGSVPDPRLLPPGAPPLAFEGYCPVTMRNAWKWVPGNPQYGIVHLGRTYWFAGPEEQKQFWTDPARYAPALSGNDPVLAIDHQQQVAGKREHSLDYDGLFYMFASEATLQQFAANPAKYAASVRQAMGLPRGRLVR